MPAKAVDKARLEAFLQRLGFVLADRPGVIFLLGGSALTWLGVKRSSVDIDVSLADDEADPALLQDAILMAGDFVEVTTDVLRLAELLPLPENYADRAMFAGQYGSLRVYCFDPYSIALTKLARSAEKDVDDVSAMLAAGFIECASLRLYFDSVFARLQRRASRSDWEDFQRRFGFFLQAHCS